MPFQNASDAEIIAKSAAVTAAFTPEMYQYLLSLLPTPESYSEFHDRFEASYAASLKGDPEKVKACEADREALILCASVLRGLAKAVTVKDPTVPKALGLGPAAEKASHFSVTLSEPHNFRAIFNPKGQLICSVARVEGAKGYQIWACEGDPSVEANWRLFTSSTTCRAILVTGLNRAKTNWLRIRAMRGIAAGPWSNYVTLPS